MQVERSSGAGRLTGGLLSFLFSLYCGMGVIGYQLDDIMTAIIPPYSSERLAGIGGGAAAASLLRNSGCRLAVWSGDA